jgi:RecA-family ATPase
VQRIPVRSASFDQKEAARGGQNRAPQEKHMNAKTIAAPAADTQHLPAELRARPQWTLAGPDKSPLTIHGTRASSTNPATWSSFEAVCDAAKPGQFIGYMISPDDPFACIDLDVKDYTTTEQIERFQRIVACFDSYTEWSRSGRGLHIWVEGKIGKGRKREGVEVYSQARFIVCTGNVHVPKPIAQRQRYLEILHAELTRGTQIEIELEDDDPDADPHYTVAQTAFEDEGELGRLFKANESDAWEGKYPSPSEADLTLVTMLARLTTSNSACWGAFQMTRLGKRIKDGRVKSERPDYRRRTLTLARTYLANDAVKMAHGKEIAEALFFRLQTPASSAAVPPNTSRYGLLFDKDLQNLPPQEWLVKRIIPDAGVGTIFGDSGTFKSFIAVDLMAHVSNGQEWFGHRVKAVPCVYVPFEGKGGVPKRIAAWRLARTRILYPGALGTFAPDDGVVTNIAFITEPMNLRVQADRDKLVATLLENKWAGGVLCIDTLAQAGGGIDENSSEGMGEMIAIFQELQARLGGVVLVIHHSGKDASRGMRGWSGLRGALDFSIECQRVDGAEQLEAQFKLDKVKDESSGRIFPFLMQRVHLGHDKDDEEVSSLIVAQPPAVDIQTQVTALPTDAQQDADDESFIHTWVKREVENGKFPSSNSLQGQLAEMKGERPMIQKRVRDAIHRLRAKSLLVTAPDKSPSGNSWLRAVDLQNTCDKT